MAKYVNVERQIGLKTAFAQLFDHDRLHFFKATNTNVSLTSEPYVSILLREKKGPAAVSVGGIAPTGRTAPKAPAVITCPIFL